MIDRNTVKLLLFRFKIVKQISRYKKINKIKIIDKKRELQVISNIKIHQKFVTNIFKNIINYSKKVQNNGKERFDSGVEAQGKRVKKRNYYNDL